MKSRKGSIIEAPYTKVGKDNLTKYRNTHPAWKGARITDGIQMLPKSIRVYRPYPIGSKLA